MGFFNSLFGRHDKDQELADRVPDLIGPFIDCAMLAVNVVEKKTGRPLPEFSQLTILVFVFGALDELCQCLKLNEQETLRIFRKLLVTKLGSESGEKAERLFQMVVRLSSMKEGQRALVTGGRAHADWRVGEKMAPLILGALLQEDITAANKMGGGDAA